MIHTKPSPVVVLLLLLLLLASARVSVGLVVLASKQHQR